MSPGRRTHVLVILVPEAIRTCASNSYLYNAILMHAEQTILQAEKKCPPTDATEVLPTCDIPYTSSGSQKE